MIRRTATGVRRPPERLRCRPSSHRGASHDSLPHRPEGKDEACEARRSGCRTHRFRNRQSRHGQLVNLRHGIPHGVIRVHRLEAEPRVDLGLVDMSRHSRHVIAALQSRDLI